MIRLSPYLIADLLELIVEGGTPSYIKVIYLCAPKYGQLFCQLFFPLQISLVSSADGFAEYPVPVDWHLRSVWDRFPVSRVTDIAARGFQSTTGHV